MFKTPLLRHSRKQYEWLWIISLAFVAIIFILKLPTTHFIVSLFRYWEIISLFIVLLHPYTILKTLCQSSYTFGLPMSKKKLLLNELIPWFIATLLYIVVMYGLSIAVEFVHSMSPSTQRSFVVTQLYLYSYMTFLVGLLVLQAMAMLILNATYGWSYRILMGILVSYNFIMLVIGLPFFETVGIRNEVFVLLYAIISSLGSLLCFQFIEKIHQ